jgi:hypothetical protein
VWCASRELRIIADSPISRVDLASDARVYFFRSGRYAGLTAVGELTSAARLQKSEFGEQVVDVKITSIVDPPLTRAALARIPAAAALPVFSPKGQQGINFRLTPEQGTSLLPSRPSDDLVSLASAERIRLYWARDRDFESLEPADLDE